MVLGEEKKQDKNKREWLAGKSMLQRDLVSDTGNMKMVSLGKSIFSSASPLTGNR